MEELALSICKFAACPLHYCATSLYSCLLWVKEVSWIKRQFVLLYHCHFDFQVFLICTVIILYLHRNFRRLILCGIFVVIFFTKFFYPFCNLEFETATFCSVKIVLFNITWPSVEVHWWFFLALFFLVRPEISYVTFFNTLLKTFYTRFMVVFSLSKYV